MEVEKKGRHLPALTESRSSNNPVQALGLSGESSGSDDRSGAA